MEDKIKVKGHLRLYLRWPLYLTILLLAVNGLVYTVSLRGGMYMSGGVVVYAAAAFFLYRGKRPAILKDLIRFSDQFGNLEHQCLDQLQIPYAILDLQGNVLWSNRCFQERIGKVSANQKHITTIFPEIAPSQVPVSEESAPTEVMASCGECIYRVVLEYHTIAEMLDESHVSMDFNADTLETALVGVYCYDETELQHYIRQNEENKLVVGLAYLDNYDEALESVEDVRKSLLTALIDRKIAKYFANMDGLVRKLEKDKYFIIMRQHTLEQMKEEKFHILDEVKTVNIGNEMAVTLSIGIGTGGATYLQNYEYCRIAIEMALGRGGDQVVIKKDDDILYYGGKAQQMEKSTRVKARVKAQAMKEFMASRDRIIVMGHKITDVDALGAAIGIYRAGKTLGKPVHIVINDPSASIKPLMAAYKDNPIYEPSIFVTGHQALELADQNTAVVVVDTNKPSYTECPELLTKTKTIIVLDHHRRGNEVIENALLSYVEPFASSACEMVAEILQYFSDDLRIRNIEADCMYAGIVIDTNNFSSRTGVRTFEAAAFLRRSGADMTRVRKLLRDDASAYQARAEAVQQARIYKEYFAISHCPSEGLESPTVVGAQAANELLNIRGVKASFVLTPFNGLIYVSARAIDEVNVQVLMEKMGGGGHINLAGAQSSLSMEETEAKLLSIIDEFYAEGDFS